MVFIEGLRHLGERIRTAAEDEGLIRARRYNPSRWNAARPQEGFQTWARGQVMGEQVILHQVPESTPASQAPQATPIAEKAVA